MKNEELDFIKEELRKENFDYIDSDELGFVITNGWQYQLNKNRSMKDVINDIRSECVFLDIETPNDEILQHRMERLLNRMETYKDAGLIDMNKGEITVSNINFTEDCYVGFVTCKSQKVIFIYDATSEKIDFVLNGNINRDIIRNNQEEISKSIIDAIEDFHQNIPSVNIDKTLDIQSYEEER